MGRANAGEMGNVVIKSIATSTCSNSALPRSQLIW